MALVWSLEDSPVEVVPGGLVSLDLLDGLQAEVNLSLEDGAAEANLVLLDTRVHLESRPETN